jgi:hypothetical protein
MTQVKRIKTSHRGVYYRIGVDGKKTYYLRPDVGGRRTWLAIPGPLENALNAQAQVRTDKIAGKLGISAPRKMLFASLADEYLKSYRLRAKPRNWPRVDSIFRQLERYFGPPFAPRRARRFHMKHVWSDYQVKVSRRPAIWGLYRRIGLWRRKLVCYFLERENARDTAKCMGKGFVVRRISQKAS